MAEWLTSTHSGLNGCIIAQIIRSQVRVLLWAIDIGCIGPRSQRKLLVPAGDSGKWVALTPTLLVESRDGSGPRNPEASSMKVQPRGGI